MVFEEQEEKLVSIAKTTSLRRDRECQIVTRRVDAREIESAALIVTRTVSNRKMSIGQDLTARDLISTSPMGNVYEDGVGKSTTPYLTSFARDSARGKQIL